MTAQQAATSQTTAQSQSQLAPQSANTQLPSLFSKPINWTYNRPSAVDVAIGLFSDSNNISDTIITMSEGERTNGLVSSATRPPFTMKVYRSSAEHNQARIHMANECPGCNAITGCDPIIIYQLYVKTNDINKILSKKG